MNTIKVRNIEIGSGTPKIIVPIVGVTKQEIIDEAKTFDSIPVDVVEWRVDSVSYTHLHLCYRINSIIQHLYVK